MTFTEADLQRWFELFTAAHAISAKVLEMVQSFAKRTLGPDELQQVLAKWDDNVARSGANAGLPPSEG